MNCQTGCLIIGALLATAQPALAQSPIALSGGFGLVSLESNEFVFDSSWTTSQLVWKSFDVPTVFAKLDVPYEGGWHFSASGEAGLAGTSHMTDYDWVKTFTASNGPNDWSHRSLHPDTRLELYFSGELRAGLDVLQSEQGRMGVHAGAGYTRTQWTAYGGSYIYSDVAYRDTVGSFAAGTQIISYMQSLPTLTAGVDGDVSFGKFSLSGSADAGVSLFAYSVDDHWLRDLRFTDTYWPGPVVKASARAAYALSDDANVHLDVAAQKIFTVRGNTQALDTSTNAVTNYGDAAGTDLLALSISGGMTGKF